MFPPFDKWPQPDIDKEPFIMAGREAFNNIFLIAISKVFDTPKNGKVGLNQFYLSIPTDTLLPGHTEVVKNTFSGFKFYKEPSTYVEHGKAAPGQEFLFVSFVENIHKASDDEKNFEAWDAKRVEDAKQRFIALLDSALVDYFNSPESGFNF